jgi:hypothetical protein
MEVTENGFLLFAAHRKRKWQTSGYLLQTDLEVSFSWLSNDKL